MVPKRLLSTSLRCVLPKQSEDFIYTARKREITWVYWNMPATFDFVYLVVIDLGKVPSA